jgi:uncharacterized protein (DUF488 family)
MSERVIYTIGHSDHSIELFIEFLKQHGITEIADVRSAPYSRFHPQFNKDALAESLKKEGIAYVFLGKELGARPTDSTCYEDGRADFNLIAKSDVFKTGLERVLKGSEPLNCHRTILICRNLKYMAVDIKHILYDGTLEDHRETESRLLKLTGCDQEELFMSETERLEFAYKRRGGEIAFRQA